MLCIFMQGTQFLRQTPISLLFSQSVEMAFDPQLISRLLRMHKRLLLLPTEDKKLSTEHIFVFKKIYLQTVYC